LQLIAKYITHAPEISLAHRYSAVTVLHATAANDYVLRRHGDAPAIRSFLPALMAMQSSPVAK